jgi:predicted metal-dependent peptidase
MADRDDIERKLSAASTWLIIDRPFLGALVLRMPLVAAKPAWCRSIATDARAIYYNPDYIAALDLEQTKFVLAHAALHCALSHFHRRGHREKCRWDIACDYAINPLLIADGLKPPPGALAIDGFADMTAEEIYPLIPENTGDRPHDEHAFDSGGQDNRSGQQPGSPGGGPENRLSGNGADGDDGADRPAPLTTGEREALAVQWQQRLAGAAQQALRAGKLRGSLARLVDHLLQPQLPWRMLLARYLTSVARDDYSFQRPSRREGAAILPSLKSASIDLVIVLDTSGSISDEEMHEFLGEINAIKGQAGARIALHACDERLAEDGPWRCEPWEELRLPEKFRGGGGTRFTPAFDWIEHQDRKPDLLVYFTDANGEFPKQEPSYPVLWLVKGKKPVPWGQRIQLN